MRQRLLQLSAETSGSARELQSFLQSEAQGNVGVPPVSGQTAWTQSSLGFQPVSYVRRTLVIGTASSSPGFRSEKGNWPPLSYAALAAPFRDCFLHRWSRLFGRRFFRSGDAFSGPRSSFGKNGHLRSFHVNHVKRLSRRRVGGID